MMFGKHKNLINTIVFSSFLFNAYNVYGDWEPENCLSDLEHVSFNELQDEKFKELKGKVSTYLKGSWCSNEKANLIMELVVLTKPKLCVEIGSFVGSSLLPIASTLKYLNHGKVIAIDGWSNEVAIKNLDLDDPNRTWWSTVDMKEVYNIYNNMIHQWNLENQCTTLVMPSHEAAALIDDQIDFLHLDGDYSEKGSVNDVNLYLPKVKSGGYILLSNLFTMVKGKQPKLKSFCALFEDCEMVCEIERDNAILFRKR